MSPFDIYKCYLSLKNHFTKEKYDYFKYCGKSRSTIKSFYGRRDRFWFEKVARNKNDKEIVDFFVANFALSDNPQNLWIGEIINSGERTYKEWVRRQQSLSYLFKEQSEQLLSNNELKDVLSCSKGHPILLKKFLGGEISLETIVIFDKIFSYRKNFDKKLDDPIWEIVSLKIQKYSPFLNNIDIFKYKKILRDILNE